MDLDNKRAQIEAISNEVRELHPLLESVLPRLPGVGRYEYTHGQFERGADFIVEVEDQSTRRRRIVGILVKTGKIDSKKVADVEEQIRECGEERPYKVLQRVRCSEVWVFASGGYTERATQKLRDRLDGRAVEFFGPEDIAIFVDQHYPFFWDQLPYDLGRYYQALGQKIALLDQSTTLVVSGQQQAPYIELDVFERVRKKYVNQQRTKPETRQVEFTKAILESKVSLLEAEMGFGKSRLVRRLVNHLASSDAFKKHGVVPVFASFKQFVEEYKGNLDSLLRTAMGSAAQILAHQDMTVLVVLDGLDECSNGVAKCSELFDQAAQQVRALHNVKLLITSRPLKSLEDKAAVYEEAHTFGIRPLSLAKIVHYLEGVCSKSNLPKRLFEDLKRSALFKQLPHSPIAAALFSNLLSKSMQEVPQSLTELYAKSMDLMLGRWDQNKHMATEKQFVTAELITERLASFFVEHQLLYISTSEAEGMIKNYLDKRNTGVTFTEVQQLLFHRSSLFSVDEEAGTISFRHRSFAEFLCAKHKEKERSLVVKDAALNPYWTNVFFFYSGLRRDCPELLAELQQLVPKNEGEEWMKALAVPNYLLAAFATEFSAVEANMKVVLLDVAKLYLRTRSGDTKTRLGELSEMHLLYLFKSIVVQSFGYEFFKPALESTALAIGDALEENEVKSYAQFFLGCAALDQGDDSVIRFLVETVGADVLPIPISLAISAELDGGSNVTNGPLLKYHRNKVQKLFVSSHKPNKNEIASAQVRLDELYKKPIGVRSRNKQLAFKK